MAVYVDEVRDYTGIDNAATRRHGHGWCHMIADTTDQLDAMALAIGLRTSYRQHSGKPLEHYDLTPSKREQAIRKRAQPLAAEEFRRLLVLRVGERVGAQIAIDRG